MEKAGIKDMHTLDIFGKLERKLESEDAKEMLNELMKRHAATVAELEHYKKISETEEDEDYDPDDYEFCDTCEYPCFSEDVVFDTTDLHMLDQYVLGMKDMAKIVHKEIKSMLFDNQSIFVDDIEEDAAEMD